MMPRACPLSSPSSPWHDETWHTFSVMTIVSMSVHCALQGGCTNSIARQKRHVNMNVIESVDRSRFVLQLFASAELYQQWHECARHLWVYGHACVPQPLPHPQDSPTPSCQFRVSAGASNNQQRQRNTTTRRSCVGHQDARAEEATAKIFREA